MMIKVWLVALAVLVPLKIAGDVSEYNRQKKVEHANQHQTLSPADDENSSEYFGGA